MVLKTVGTKEEEKKKEAGQDRAGQGGEVIPKYVGEGKPLRIHRSFLVMFLFRTDPEEVQTWRYPWGLWGWGLESTCSN